MFLLIISTDIKQILFEIVPILIFFLIQENQKKKVEKTKRNENAKRYIESVNSKNDNDNTVRKIFYKK